MRNGETKYFTREDADRDDSAVVAEAALRSIQLVLASRRSIRFAETARRSIRFAVPPRGGEGEMHAAASLQQEVLHYPLRPHMQQ